MKKFFSVICCLIFFGTVSVADTSSTDTSLEIIEKIQQHRSIIYSALNLTFEQQTKINALDDKYFKKINPQLNQMNCIVKNMENIANSNNVSLEAIEKEKIKFENIQKSMESIKNAYDTELQKILTPEQQKQYDIIRKQQQQEIETQIRAEQLRQNNKN